MSSDLSSPLAVYRAHLADGELAYQFSPAAGRAVFFPRLFCPFTGSADLVWRVSAGQGTVYASSAVTPARGGEPYNVALIDLDEGFRMMSAVTGTAPDDVAIGMRVSARFTVIDGEPAVQFERAAACTEGR